jgi:hypothetical protein
MMAFQKQGGTLPVRSVAAPKFAETANRMAAVLPKIALDVGMGIVRALLKALPALRKYIVSTLSVLLPKIPGINGAVAARAQATFDGLLEMLQRFEPLANIATQTPAAPLPSAAPSSSAPLVTDCMCVCVCVYFWTFSKLDS